MSTFVLRLLNADRSWNLDLVRNEFGSLDTECILQVSTLNPDRVIWHFGKRGTFSVSSAYKSVAEQAEEASSSSTGTCSGAAGICSSFGKLRCHLRFICSLGVAVRIRCHRTRNYCHGGFA
ncbi:UNVERIFIED_CONTAM: hypothetical protein Sangu_1708600 [Sesamum angustifolium]|uniref:Uncharacterized protein n=1 Tax=Sesamum angustifolium TaxID=2727405 RepID=A0AAW2MND1_9LAMI